MDAAATADRPVAERAGLLWYLVLVIGTAGDAITFKTIVAILMPTQTVYEAWTLTAAFTVTSIGLMHAAGVSARKAGNPRAAAASMLGVVWAALGGGAFWVRLTQTTPTDDLSGSLDLQGSPAGGATAISSNYPMALLFAALFVASGAVAAWFAYNKGPSRTGVIAQAWRARRARRQPIRDARLEHRLSTRIGTYAARRRRRLWVRNIRANAAARWRGWLGAASAPAGRVDRRQDPAAIRSRDASRRRHRRSIEAAG